MKNSPSSRKGARASAPSLGGWSAKVTEHVSFFSSFLREPMTVGSVCPSSKALARAMLEGFAWEAADTVVEIGPGTGAFTSLIRERLGERTTFLALELNGAHVQSLRQRFPDLLVYHDSAERMVECLTRHGKKQTDYVVSGLPWTSLPAAGRERILQAILAVLAPRGLFTTFAYVHACWLPAARQFRKHLQARFEHVTISPIVWRNFPPAFVYRCSHASAG